MFRAKSALEQFEQLQLQLDWEELEHMDRDEVDLIVAMIRQCRSDLWKEWKKTYPREEKINKNVKRWEELKNIVAKLRSWESWRKVSIHFYSRL